MDEHNPIDELYGMDDTVRAGKKGSWEISKVATGNVLSAKAFNAVLGGLLVYGFLLNALICGLFTRQIASLNPFVLVGGYLVASLAGILMANISQSAVIRFVGYNLLVVPSGMVIASVLPAYHFQTVMHALVGTALIAGVMLAAAMIKPKLFEGLGPVLCLSLLSAIGVELVLLFVFHSSSIWIDIAVILIMAVFIGFDFLRANAGYRTLNNAVAFAMDLYLDILNIFIRLLSVLGHKD